MALDDIKHVEACALLRRVIEEAGELIPFRTAVERWLEENHPPPSAYMAAAHHLAGNQSEEQA